MISRTGIHALKALAALAEEADGDFVGAAVLAERIDAPRNYLGKLLQTLAREGLVVAQKGLNGGFRLARPAESIRLTEVIEPIEHLSRWHGCFLGRSRCSDQHPCKVHRRWSRIREEYLGFLESTTVADL